MTVDSCKLNHYSCSTNVVSLLKQICTSSVTWYAAGDVANAFSSVSVSRDHQPASPAIYLHCPTSEVHQLSSPMSQYSWQDLDGLSLLRGITLGHYFDDFMLIGPSEQGVVSTWDFLVRHLHVREQEKNPTKIQRPSTSLKCLGAQWHVEISFLRQRIRCCIWLPLQPRKRYRA